MKKISLMLTFLITSSLCYSGEQKQSPTFQESRRYFQKLEEQKQPTPIIEQKTKRPIGETIRKNHLMIREAQTKRKQDYKPQPSETRKLPSGPVAAASVSKEQRHDPKTKETQDRVVDTGGAPSTLKVITASPVHKKHQKKTLDLSHIPLTDETFSTLAKEHGQERKLKIILPESLSQEALIRIVRSFPLLYSLEIKNNYAAGNNYLEIIKTLKHIKHLTLTSLPGIADLRAVGEMQSLEYLNVSNLSAADLSPIGQLINLKKLVLSKLPSFQGYLPLKSLKSLKEIYLSDMPQINTLSSFKFPENIVKITLVNFENLDDITALQNLKKLESITFLGLFDRLKDLEVLAHIASLKRIEVPQYFEATHSNVLDELERQKNVAVFLVNRFLNEPYPKKDDVMPSLPSGPYQAPNDYVPIADSVFVAPYKNEEELKKRQKEEVEQMAKKATEGGYKFDAFLPDPVRADVKTEEVVPQEKEAD
jgi:Leucine-rich repeat (LRR) protein